MFLAGFFLGVSDIFTFDFYFCHTNENKQRVISDCVTQSRAK